MQSHQESRIASQSCLKISPRDDNFALCQTEVSRTVVEGQRSAASEHSKFQSENHHSKLVQQLRSEAGVLKSVVCEG